MIFFYYPLLLFKVDTTIATQSCGLIYNMLIKMTKDPQENLAIVPKKHCVKSVQIRNYFWSVFSCIRIEYGPEITPHLDTFHAVKLHR